MKIAVLFFGQPRFFDLVAPFIRKYFYQISHDGGPQYHITPTSNKSFVTYEIDYFAHFWKNINYSPKTPEEEVNVDKLVNILQEQFAVLDENYCIEDYSVLEDFGNNLHKFHNCLGGIFNDKKHRPDMSYAGLNGLYGTGQYYSFGEVYNLMEAYESRNSFKYDVVLRLRTDYIINGLDIHDLINFKTYSIPMMKVACGNVDGKILHKAREVEEGFNKSYYLLNNYGKRDPKKLGYDNHQLGLPRIRDHVWCYNRLGADIFVQKYWMYYFLVFIHDYLNIPLSLPSYPQTYAYMNRNRYHSCEVLHILIAGMTGAKVERINYDIFRVCHSTTKEKYRNTGIVLTDYSSFNDNNEKLLDVLDDYLKEYLSTLPAKNKDKHKMTQMYLKKDYNAFCYEI